MSGTWRNWAGNVVADPAAWLRPSSVDELAELLAQTAASGRRIRAVGAGHSFTSIAAGAGAMIDVSRLAGVRSIAPRADGGEGADVTVGAGTRLRDLNALLAAERLALPNLGDIDHQTIAGALSTGTHGTGGRRQGLAAQVVGVELATADGRVLELTAEADRDLFEAARLSLGALGVIAAVTLRVVPAFVLQANETPMGLDEVLGDLDSLVADNDHFEFFWFPHTRRVLAKRNNRVEEPRPLPAWRGLLEDEVASNGAFWLVNQLSRFAPRLTPALNAVSARALAPREYADDSFRVFCSPRRVRFAESEYAIARRDVPRVLGEIASWLRRSRHRVAFPIEVRFAAADDVWLSTAYGRDVAYIAAHEFAPLDYHRYFAAVADVMDSAGARPHWGKLHRLRAPRLAELYPRFGDFRAVRDRLDPARVFANPYLDRVLGR